MNMAYSYGIDSVGNVKKMVIEPTRKIAVRCVGL
jgi:hypothetical protein